MYRCRLTRYNIIAYGSYWTVVRKSTTGVTGPMPSTVAVAVLSPSVCVQLPRSGQSVPDCRHCGAAGWAAGRTAPVRNQAFRRYRGRAVVFRLPWDPPCERVTGCNSKA
ncbi:unnamed protein product [Calypogeia fissa]